MNFSFPDVRTARYLSDEACSFEHLVIAAGNAIREAAKNTLTQAEIYYSAIDDVTHAKFHHFITSKGYEGGKSNHATKGMIYRIKW